MIKNGWHLYHHRLFAQRLTELEQAVASLAARDPTGYKLHPQTKLLASVFKAINETVPANPADPVFRLGHTLGDDNAHWRRVKKGMPQRYRLFFRFASFPLPLIVYVWLNDKDSLRKEGAKTDVYARFRAMLARGEVPAGIDDLIRDSTL
jgi:toxin YhaV